VGKGVTRAQLENKNPIFLLLVEKSKMSGSIANAFNATGYTPFDLD
jgi:hypothetical protein